MLPFMMLLLATNSLYDMLRSRSVEAFYSVAGTVSRPSSQPDFIRRLLDLEGMPDELRQGVTAPSGEPEEHLKAYLKSHSCRSLCVRIQTAILSNRFEEFEQRLRTEFLFTHNIGYPGSREEANELAGNLWPILVVAFQWIARAVRSDDKWMSLLGDVETLDRPALESIDISLPILTSYSDDQIEMFLEFEKVYRRLVKLRHGRLRVQDINSRLVDMEDLYIAPQLEVAIRGQDPVKVEPPQFLLFFMHAIILGNPGAGKSTLANKLCYDLAVGQWSGADSDAGLTPLLVVLRDYPATEGEARQSLIEYLTYDIMSQYQLVPPEGMIDFLFAAGRGVVVFDGLDEILAPADRHKVVMEIELFVSKYPYVPVIVASRTVGYDEAPLDKSKFARCTVDAFSDRQIKEYISHWFALQTDLSSSGQLEAVRGFLAASATIKDLVANPLLLSLLCSTYRGLGYIPRNRADLYEKSFTLLFERWDRMRGLSVPEYRPHYQNLLGYIAYFILNRPVYQAGVTEDRLVSVAVQYFLERVYNSSEAAEQAATEFLQFCRGRAWVLSKVGIAASGVGLYQFTHKSFLEYFAGRHIARMEPSSRALALSLRGWVEEANSEWDMPAQLAIQMHAEMVNDAHEVIKEMLSWAGPDVDWVRRVNILSFIVRCLVFFIPPLKLVRAVIYEILHNFLSLNDQAVYLRWLSVCREMLDWQELFESAISVIEDMLVEMVEESADLVDMVVEGADPAFGERAIIFGLYLAEIMGIQDGSLDRGDQNAHLRSASLRLRHRFAEPMRELAPTSLAMTIEALGGRMEVDAALTLHGSSLLFGQPDLQPFLAAVPPLALRLVTQYLHQSAGEADSSVLEAVARDLFSYVIEGASSGYSAHEVASARLTNFSDLRPSNVRFDPLGWSSPARDTAIVLLAVLSEFSIERLGDRNLYRSFSEWLNVSHEQSIDVLLPVRIRYSNPHVDPYWRPPDEGISALMLAPQTSDLLLGWTSFERNFIRYD